jgi:hypothetical protein
MQNAPIQRIFGIAGCIVLLQLFGCDGGSFVGSSAKRKDKARPYVDDGGEICNKNRPVIGEVKPIEKWHWAGWTSPAGKKYGTTYSSPAAADLDGDGKTEVVVISSQNENSITDNGPVVVLEGSSGKPLWNSREALQLGAMVSQTPILADLDGDGTAEIIFSAFVNPTDLFYSANGALVNQAQHAAAYSAVKIVALDYKLKVIKYQYSSPSLKCGDSGGFNNGYCMGAAADIDGDGKIEVVFGNSILSNTLTLKKNLTNVGDAQPSTVTLANLDVASPGLEVIVNGSSVFSSAGNLLWSGSCRGYSAVSDVDNDGSSELVCMGWNSNKLTLFSKTGVVIWQSLVPKLPDDPSEGGGPPNVGNFLGDEKFEIGLAGGDYYVVFDHLGKEVWKERTTDRSSRRTGSTIFDFNGDGKMEVIYNDEQKLRIYSGESGQVLWETDNPSGTLWEYPVVANVDDDISSELIVSSPTLGGLRVFEDPKNLWMYSRRVWNQYSYFPELVDDFLKTTPILNQNVRHGFRVNSQGLNSPEKNPCQ